MNRITLPKNKAAKPSWSKALLHSIFAIVSIPLFIHLSGEFKFALELMHHGEKIIGQVKKVNEYQCKGRSSAKTNNWVSYRCWSPLIEFVYRDKTYSVENTVRSNTIDHAEGEQIEVVFVKDRPESARINDFLNLYGLSFALLIISLAFSIPALFYWGLFILAVRYRGRLMREESPIIASPAEVKRVKNKKTLGASAWVYELVDTTGRFRQKFYSDVIYSHDSPGLETGQLYKVFVNSKNKEDYVVLKNGIS